MRKLRDYENYIRYDAFPTLWCPGCGNGAVLKAIAVSLAELGADPNDVVVVSGIGCSGRMSTYLNVNTLHTTHGRALAFATGIKLSKPDKLVIVVSGDGDALAIGGNHFIHAARRNIGVKLILINNGTFGMTGGQVSPTSQAGFFTETTPYGNFEPAFDTIELLKGLKASFAARESVSRYLELKNTIKSSFEHKGFSTVEVISNCNVNFGRKNNMKTTGKMLDHINEYTYLLADADKMTDEEKKGKYALGIFSRDESQAEYAEHYYNKIVPIAKAAHKKEGNRWSMRFVIVLLEGME